MVFLKIARWSILHCLLLFFLQNYFFKLTLLNHCHHIKCFLYFNYCLTSKPSGAGQGWLCGGLRSDCRAANRRCRGSIRRARVALSQRSGCQETRVVECKLMKCACLLLVHMGVWVCVHGAKYDAPASRLLGVTHLRLFFSVCACMDAHVRVCCVSLLQAYVWLCLHMCACVCLCVVCVSLWCGATTLCTKISNPFAYCGDLLFSADKNEHGAACGFQRPCRPCAPTRTDAPGGLPCHCSAVW